MTDKGPITFKKENDLLNFLITLFSILQREGNDKEITIDNGKISIRTKDPSEINKLHADTKKLEAKIFRWFDMRAAHYVTFDQEESDLIRHCIHAAHYFVTEKEAPESLPVPFINYYNYLKDNNFI